MLSEKVLTPDHAPHGRSLNRFTTVVLIAYLLFIVALMVLRRATLSAEVFVVFASVVAVMLGRGRAFVRDWAPFLLIFLAWQAMRSLADDIGARVQSDSVIAVERFITFGSVPSVEAQKAWFVPGQISVLDVTMTLVYLAHFLLPLIAALLLWVFRRHLYYPYVMALMLLSFAQFATAVLLPVAPPRFAGLYGEGLPVHDISLEVTRALHLGTLSWAYQNLNGNPVAAFPSLHAAYPILAYVFLRQAWPRGAWLMLGWGALVMFAIVYLAHHYVVDAIGGVVYALAAFYVVDRLRHSDWVRATLARWRGRFIPSRT
ncbi:MAG: phosphatase PAP2 family protein [Chloroflexota bacterium]|nr:phosphatase PAP2 family protein [Chloroflexota bacterium]